MADIHRYSGAARSGSFFLSEFAHLKACVIVLGMGALDARFPASSFPASAHAGFLLLPAQVEWATVCDGSE